MGEIISESSIVESKMDGSPMNADELRLAQMGMSLHLKIEVHRVLKSIRSYSRVEASFQYPISDRPCIYDDNFLDGSWAGHCH